MTFDYEALNPGIRETVRWLHGMGFKTLDSGDGQTHEFECDRDYPYVVVQTSRVYLAADASMIYDAIKERGIAVGPISTEDTVQIQATYDPATDIPLIEIMGLDDARLTTKTHPT